MEQVLLKNSGFTMIEVIMATLILMVGMLGLLQAVNLATEVNMRNQIRDESVYLGERVMNELRGKALSPKGFDNLSASYKTYSSPTKMRGIRRMYGVQRSAAVLSANAETPVKQLEVVITWKYKGAGYQNRLVAPISVQKPKE